MVPLKRWWLTQASMDIAKDAQLLDLMRESGCIGIFFGIESFGAESLEDAHKRQNRVAEYRERDRGAAPARHLRHGGLYRRLRRRHAGEPFAPWRDSSTRSASTSRS